MSAAPEPAVFGTGAAAKSMYAAFYGDLAPPVPLAELSQDAYSLFYARSAAMGWLTPAEDGAAGGLWGTNDAEAGRDSGPRFSLLLITCVEASAMVEKLPQADGEDEIPENGVLYACQDQRSRLLVGQGKQKAAKGAERN